jgi:hypothetical protein
MSAAKLDPREEARKRMIAQRAPHITMNEILKVLSAGG